MQATAFLKTLERTLGISFFAGVPDSHLRPVCDALTSEWGVGAKHVIAQNEGGAVGLAAGHYLATGSPAMVYLQNSGLGNVVNPVCSLMEPYRIPALFLIGWRGEPGVEDEPQHRFQGEITLPLLETIGLQHFVLDPGVTRADFEERVVPLIQEAFAAGEGFALVARAGVFKRAEALAYRNSFSMSREQAVAEVLSGLEPDTAVVSTTGKLSRELFETRQRLGQSHSSDFLTVGSMGHTSLIGAGVALADRSRKVAILDGDGSMLMHMGSLPVLASLNLPNVDYFLFNNAAHESVGGMPTVADRLDFKKLAEGAGFKSYHRSADVSTLNSVMEQIVHADGPTFCVIDVSLEVRKDLGRPTETPVESKEEFMDFLERTGS